MSSEALLLDDQEARAAALDVSRSFIVQAPAGSGKTELLIQRYLRLLAIVDHPEEVLAITFTRKAAAEMQFRVLQALKSCLRGDAVVEDHQKLTQRAAAEVLQRDASREWNLSANPGRLRIQTLDSLNATISRIQPVSSGSGAAHNAIVADAEMQALYRKAAFLTLDQLPESGDELQAATEQVLTHLDNNTALYSNYVSRMLATRDQWLPFVGSGQIGSDEANHLRSGFEHSLETVVLQQLQQVHEALPAGIASSLLPLAQYAASQLRDAGELQNPIAELHDVSEFKVSPKDIAVWQSLAELLLTRQGHWRKTVTKAQGFPAKDSGQKDAIKDLLADLGSATLFQSRLHACRDLPPTRYNDVQWAVLLALFRLLPLAVTELQRLFAERGITDYIEVALSAANALGTAGNPGDVALLLDYQLRHLLVDEMQDTASAQYRMLESLTGGWTEGDGRTMFCVGDPMQSIYRFRNAEVGQFLLAKERGIGNIVLTNLTLRRNFRSGEKLVDWYNDVFPSILADKDDAAESAVAYAKAVSVPQHTGQGECTAHALFGTDADAEARRGCEVIREIQAANPDDQVAILVRSRTHLSKLLAKLRRQEIAYGAIEIDRLTDLPEIIDVLALTRALVHRGDRLAWLALLRSPWAGLHWTDLHSLVAGAPANCSIWELTNDAERLAMLSPFGRSAVLRLTQVLETEMGPNRIDPLRDRVERLWLALGGPAILDDAENVANVYRYLDVLEQLEVGGTLLDSAKLEAALDVEHVSSESNARLQVMTMHRAKGLQFDHVLLYGLGHAPGRHERAVLNWFDIPAERGTSMKVLSPVGARAEIENDPLHRFIEKVENRKFQHELGRLLYVACTRAKKSLHLMGHVGLGKDETEFKPPRSDTLLHLLWPAVSATYDTAFASNEFVAGNEIDSPWKLPKLHRFESEWSLPEFHELLPTNSDNEIEASQAEVEFYWVGSEARTAGTLVHRWLQLVAADRVRLDNDGLSDIGATTLRWLRGMGITGQSADTIVERTVTALQKTFSDDQGRWILDGPGSAELALSGVIDGQITSVVLDRVRVDDDGVHWIVDYKTSTHEGGKLESFLQAEVDRYTPQLAKYEQLYRSFTNADVRCALYFPLLQKFVPVAL